MGGAEDNLPRRKREESGRKGLTQQRGQDFLPLPPTRLPFPPVLSGIPYHHLHSCCTPPSNTVHHFGVAQLLNAASVCNNEFNRSYPLAPPLYNPSNTIPNSSSSTYERVTLSNLTGTNESGESGSNNISLNYIVNGTHVPVNFEQSGSVRIETVTSEKATQEEPEISISALKKVSSGTFSRPSSQPRHFPFGPEVLTNGDPEVTRRPQTFESNIDLSKLNHLSRLACEVAKLDTGRQKRVEEILRENKEPSDSPVIVVTAINGKPLEGGDMLSNGNGSDLNTEKGGGGLRMIKREKVETAPSLEEGSGDEVLDLRKPLLSSLGKVCLWCGKHPTLMENGLESDFCTELCFHMFRRDSFKKRSNCIWCSGVGGLKGSGITLQGTIDESRFCSEECLTNFKLKLFCEETSALSAHIEQLQEYQINATSSVSTSGGGITGKSTIQRVNDNPELITPELWLSKKHEFLTRKGSSGDSSPKSGGKGKLEQPLEHNSSNSPLSDSPHQQQIATQLQALEVVQHPLKSRLYTAFQHSQSRRRPNSPNRGTNQQGQLSNHPARKRTKTNNTTNSNSAGIHSPVSMPMPISIIQMGAALAAMNSAKPPRKSGGLVDINNSLSTMMIQKGTCMTHSALHAGGLMVSSSPTNSNTSASNQPVTISPMIDISSAVEDKATEKRFALSPATKKSPPQPKCPKVSTYSSATQTDPVEVQLFPMAYGVGSLIPPVTILVPYPVPFPMPLPMPMFFPEQGRKVVTDSEELPKQEVLHEEEKDIQTAIQLSLQEKSNDEREQGGESEVGEGGLFIEENVSIEEGEVVDENSEKK